MRLPNAELAIVDIVKLRDYCLSSAHPRGRHKARVFAATLGLSAEDAELLRDTILRAVLSNEAISGESDAYGRRYLVDFRMSGLQGEAVVRSS